ncbi:hypothetical protein [Rubritalea tangerina]|uniref:Uncharacterized protein n=1 Tax=Rubritalea tangerina TaxID=430798 RepID=A0ABW4ZBP6_9BACT
MKLFIYSASALALFAGLSSCEKHEWKDDQGKGVVELYKSDDDHGHDAHGDHGHDHKHEDKAGHAESH